MNDTLKKYFQDVKGLLPCSSKEKKRCIMELEADVSAFFAQHPDATLEDLYASIGTPELIAESYISRIEPKQLSHRLSVKRRIAIGVIAIVAFLAIFVGALATIIAYKYSNFYDGYFVDTITEVPEDDDPNQLPLSEY